jgi:hypothetical protein
MVCRRDLRPVGPPQPEYCDVIVTENLFGDIII